MGYVTVGGDYDSPKTYDMTGNQFVVVPKSIQKDAVAEHTIVYYSLVVESRCSFKINPDNGVEAIKGCRMRRTSLLAGDRMVRLLETSTASKIIILLTS
jgi:hypothetical protein